MLTVLIVAASLGAACRETPVAPSEVQLGEPFELRIGESAALPGGLRVRFHRVVSDSRCPIDAICVTAGEARLALQLSLGSDGPVEREVRVDSEMAEVSFLRYRIKAVLLMPYPRSDRAPRPEEFVATFSVTR